MKAVDRRAQAIISRLGPGPLIGAEVGVFRGRLSERLLRGQTITLHMVDSWLPTEKQPERYRNSGDLVAQMSAIDIRRARQEALAKTAFAVSRRVLHEMDSVAAADIQPDSFFDFVFIDADHSYEGCARDLTAWLPKVKPHGLLCGHDYGNANFPGVKRAVDEFCEAHGFVPETGDDNTWFVRLP